MFKKKKIQIGIVGRLFPIWEGPLRYNCKEFSRTFMARVGIQRIARELGVKPKRILDALPEIGIDIRKRHYASLDWKEADRLRKFFQADSKHPEKELNQPIERLSFVGSNCYVRLSAQTEKLFDGPDTRIPCELCSARVFPHAMDRHLANSCPAKFKQTPQKLPNLAGMRFPFVTLPPGQWEYRQVFEHYRRLKAHQSFDQLIDWDRITQLGKLNPTLRHFGAKGWFGYAVYEFSYTRKVVFECPVKGNATYVISGDWTRLIRKTKFVLRSEFGSQCRRIVHTGDWLAHVSETLREGTHRHVR